MYYKNHRILYNCNTAIWCKTQHKICPENVATSVTEGQSILFPFPPKMFSP